MGCVGEKVKTEGIPRKGNLKARKNLSAISSSEEEAKSPESEIYEAEKKKPGQIVHNKIQKLKSIESVLARSQVTRVEECHDSAIKIDPKPLDQEEDLVRHAKSDQPLKSILQSG